MQGAKWASAHRFDVLFAPDDDLLDEISFELKTIFFLAAVPNV
jgi:hypothetical protein